MNDNNTENNKLKEKLIQKILECIPSNIKSIDYLMDILELGRESVYRRLKGDIPFTLKEVMSLSANLGFSVDELISEAKAELATFGITSKDSLNAQQSFHSIQESYHDVMHDLHQSANSSLEISMSRAISFLISDRDTLHKFFYYKWIHQYEKVPLNYYLADINVPENVKNICRKTLYYAKHINTVIIFEPAIFYNLFQEIKYFYQRKLISAEEMKLLKEELKDLLQYMEEIVQNGVNDTGVDVHMYVSSLHIGNNSMYIERGKQAFTFMGIHSGSSIYTKDKQICLMHKAWIDSLKKYSTLISNSNERMQADFFNQQYSYLEEL